MQSGSDESEPSRSCAAARNHARLFKEEQYKEAYTEHAGDGPNAAALVFGEEMERGKADRGSGENSDADRGFMQSAVRTFLITDVHRVVERGIINQAGAKAEDELIEEYGPEVGQEQQPGKGGDQRHIGGEQQAKPVVPAGPEAQEHERSKTGKQPDRAEYPREGG